MAYELSIWMWKGLQNSVWINTLLLKFEGYYNAWIIKISQGSNGWYAKYTFISCFVIYFRFVEIHRHIHKHCILDSTSINKYLG